MSEKKKPVKKSDLKLTIIVNEPYLDKLEPKWKKFFEQQEQDRLLNYDHFYLLSCVEKHFAFNEWIADKNEDPFDDNPLAGLNEGIYYSQQDALTSLRDETGYVMPLVEAKKLAAKIIEVKGGK